LKKILLGARVGDGRDVAKAIHYVGAPPSSEGVHDVRQVLPIGEVLLIEDHGPSGIFLIRYLADGTEVGDTWHQSVDDAKAQARYELGDQLGSWRPIAGHSTPEAAIELLCGD
jgi:hypothetical protein